MKGQEFTIPFKCKPYRYQVGDMFETAGISVRYPSVNSITPIDNEGSVSAWPVFEVSTGGSGGTLTIGGKTLIVGSCPKTMYIDCGAKYAYTIDDDGTMEFANMYLGGDWPELVPGLNTLIVAPAATTGSSITVVMRARWRYL